MVESGAVGFVPAGWTVTTPPVIPVAPVTGSVTFPDALPDKAPETGPLKLSCCIGMGVPLPGSA